MQRPMNAIGMAELTSIASGYEVADTMLKAADVELLVSRTICSGKYMVIVGGLVDAVTAAVEAGVKVGGLSLIDSCVIANIHPAVFPAIVGTETVEVMEALGIIESFSVVSLIEAADTAVKTGNVRLMEIRLAMALGGKAFVTLTGDVSSVQAAVEAGAARVAEKGLLVNRVVIPAPRRELLREWV
ncbi:MAG: BMC domain-containing protein [Abditibacteriales bacterium]|nr:BMC domain-containing protein [Abditibacteriales bacterium]